MDTQHSARALPALHGPAQPHLKPCPPSLHLQSPCFRAAASVLGLGRAAAAACIHPYPCTLSQSSCRTVPISHPSPLCHYRSSRPSVSGHRAPGCDRGGISATRARLTRSSRQASADRHLLTPCSCCSRFSSSCKLIAAFNFLPTHLLLLAGSFVEQEGEAKGQPWLWGLLMGRQLRGCGA